MEVLPRIKHQLNSYVNRISIVGAIMAGFVLRVLSLDFQEMWRDEVDQWHFALSPVREQLGHFFEMGWNGPLFSPLLRLWMEGTGESVFAMRYFSLLCGVLSIALVYVLCWRLVGRNAAVWSAWLYAFSPYMVWYAQEVKMYTWVPMLVLLGCYSLERACHQPVWTWWMAVFVAVTLSFYSHILAVFMIPVQFAWFWLIPHRHKKAWVGGLLVFLLLVVPYLPLLIWQLPMVLSTRETGYPALTLLEMVMTVMTGWTAGIYMGAWTDGILSYLITGFVCACAGVGWMALAGNRLREKLKLTLWMLFPLLSIWFVSLKGPIFTDRYVIWSAPAFIILVAAGITQFARIKRVFMWSVGFCVLLSTFPALYSQAVFAIKPQFKNAAAYVMQHSSGEDLLLFQIPYNSRVFEFYTPYQVYLQESAPFTNWQLADGSYQVGEGYVDQEMRRIVADYPRVWLVYSEVKLWDERELVKSWLDTRWVLFDQRHYQGVAVYGYQRP